MTPPLRVVVSGSECTGKTTLTEELARTFGAPRSLEFAREYLAGRGTPLTADDVDPIARGQMAGEDAVITAGASLVLHDTDLVSTALYARHYYGSCPAWIEEKLRTRRADLYLLLHPDVPWVSDGLQRDRGTERALLHGLFVSALESAGATVVDVRGAWPERSAIARAAVSHLIRTRDR